jgi:monomeric sarcosine oxidase
MHTVILAGNYDIAVIGAGVFGSWIAYRFADTGQRVALLDGYGAVNPRSTSGCRSRIMRMAYGEHELYTRFANESLPAWKQLDRDLFIRTGVLWLSRADNERFQASRATLQQFGIPFEVYDARELARRYPQMSAPRDAVALLEPESGALLATKCVQAVVDLAQGLGVDFLPDAVRRVSSDALTTASGRRIQAETYIFACGPWLPNLFPELLTGVIRPTRQEVLFFGPPPSIMIRPPCLPIWIDDTDPRLPYGFPDLGGDGVKVAFHREGPAFDPDDGDRIVTSAQVEEARQYLAGRFPMLDAAPLVDSRVCQYENTPTGDFLIDRHPEYQRFWLVGGGSGHGFKHAPAVAEYVFGRIQEDCPEEPRFTLRAHAGRHERSVF